MGNIRRISKKYGLRQIVTFFLVCCMFCNPAVMAEVVLEDQVLGSGITVTSLNGGTTQSMTAGNGGIGYFSDFDIALGHTVTCVQGDPSYNALFKVDSVTHPGTQIDGIFTSDGNIYLQDLRGILIGSEGQINTNEFIASTLNIKNSDWQAFITIANNQLKFERGVEDPTGLMENRGTINASKVYLIGSQVLNSGTIKAGENASDLLVMAAGDKVFLTHEGSKVLIKVPTDLVTPDLANNKVENVIDDVGKIKADQVVLAAGDVFTAALDVGSLAATANRDITLNGSVDTVGDTSLIADADLILGGDVTTNGAITAGGNVDIAGNHIELNEDVSANNGDLTITGRTSKGVFYGEFIEGPEPQPEGYWGHIDVADTEDPEGRTLYASHDVILKDAYGSGGDEEPPAGEMDLKGHGSLTIEAAGGSIQTQGPFGEGVKITVQNSSLTMKQADPLNLVDYSFGNQNNTHLTLESYNGSVAAVDSHQLFTLGVMGKDENAADQWASIGAGAATAGTTGYGNITLQGHDLERDITATELTSNATDPYIGNIIVTSDNRKVRATGEIIANNGSVTLSAINPDNGGIDLHANVTSGDFQDYIGDVDLKNDVTTESTGGSDITFTGTVDGTYGLTVNTAGVTKFQGKVGGTDPLASLITDELGRTEIGAGFIHLDGDSATFGDPVLLTSDLRIYEYGAGDIEFASTVDSIEGDNYQLVVTNSGATIFNGAVGNDALGDLSDDEGLGAVTTDSPGTTQINGGIVTTTGDQTYHDPVTLGADTILNGTDVMFGQTLNSDSGNKRSLLVNASGVTTFNGIVGGDYRLSHLETDAAGRTEIGAGTINLDGASAKFGDPVLLTSNLHIDEDGAGNIEFADTVDSEEGHNYGLWVYNSGATIFNGAVGSDALGSLSQDTGLNFVWTDSDGTTQINGGSVTTYYDQTYHDPVTLGADTILNGTNVNFMNTLDSDSGGNRTLLVNASGVTKFKGEVGGIKPLASLETDADVGGTDSTHLFADVTTTGTQTYNDDVDLMGDVIAESTGDSAITFAKTVDGAHNLTVNTGGITKFLGEVGGDIALASLTTDADGSTEISTDVTTTGTQTYNDDVDLKGDVISESTGDSAITFAKTVDGAHNLTVNTGGITKFQGEVGGDIALASLTTDADGSTEISTDVTTTGTQTYNDDVDLKGDVIAESTGDSAITFAKTVDGAHNLTVNTGGITKFQGEVGGDIALASLTTDADGSTEISTNVTTTGTQTYNDDVDLKGDVIAESTGDSVITFAKTVDGAHNLTVNTGDITKFLDEVGGDIALASLTTDADGSTEISTNVKTTGTQTYNDDVDLMGDVTAESTGDAEIKFAKTVDGGHNLIVNTGGDTRFGGNVGSDTPLTTLTTDVGGTTYVKGDVTTTSGIHFGDDVIADGTGSALPQTLDAGAETLDVDGNLEKNTAGNLNLTGDAGIELGGNVYGTGGFRAEDTITFEDDVTADGGSQSFNAGPGTLDADGHIEKTTAGSLNLGGETGILLAGNVSTGTDGDGFFNDLIFEDAVTADGTGVNKDQTFTAGPLASNVGSSVYADSTITKIDGGDPLIDHDGGNLTIKGGWQVNLTGDVDVKDGTLTVEADQDISLGSSAISKGDMILTADADGDAEYLFDNYYPQYADIIGGDVTVEGDLDSTDGSITISGFDETIYLGGDVTAAVNVTLNNNTEFFGDDDQEVDAQTGTIIANGWLWKTSRLGSLYLEAADDISLADEVGAYGGGVSIISENGKIFTPDECGDETDTLNVYVYGWSDDYFGDGVDLPHGPGKAAIVIMSAKDLKLGSDAELVAEGYYDDPTVDDRQGVDFLDARETIGGFPRDEGDPFDVAVYLASTEGDVDVSSPVTIGFWEYDGDNGDVFVPEGAMVIDAWNSVTFDGGVPGGMFETSLADGFVGDRLEVVSRRSEWLFQTIGLLPYAEGGGPFPDDYAYVLRGAGRDNPLITDGGAWVLEDPILPPPLYEEAGEAAEDQDIAKGGCPPLMNWLANEIGVAEEDIQVALAGALALNTDIQPCEMCARLMEAAKRLEDAEGTQIAAMARVVNEFATTPAPPSPEQMTQIAAAMAEHVGDGTYYAAAGIWIDALVVYVGIMNTEMGYSATDSVAFAQKYLTPVTDSGNAALNAYVQARLAALGG